MSKVVLKFLLSIFFFAALGFNTNSKVEAEILPTDLYAFRGAQRARKYYFFKSYSEYLVSPNRQYTIVWTPVWRNNMRVRRNYLYDINTDSLITNIRSCKPMPYQSYGGISTTWRYDSQVALITYNDRWAPRDACLVSVNGAQINVYNQIQRDARAYLANRDINFLKNKNNLVVDFFRSDYLLRMTNNRLTVLATVYTPKSRVYSQSLLMNYRYQVIGTLIEFHLVDIQRT